VNNEIDDRIWSIEALNNMFFELAEEHDMMHKWPEQRNPTDKEGFRLFCIRKAKELSRDDYVVTPGAVQQQIAFVTTRPKKYNNIGHIWTWIRNWHAAIEAGFARPVDLPSNIAFDLSYDLMLQHAPPKKKSTKPRWYEQQPMK